MSIKKKSKELKLPKEKKRAPAQKKRRSRLGKHNMAPFLAPSIIGVTLFFLLPFLVVIFYSFVDNPVTKEWVWFDNFVRLVKNNSFKRAVKNTAVFTAIAVPLAVVLSCPQKSGSCRFWGPASGAGRAGSFQAQGSFCRTPPPRYGAAS